MNENITFDSRKSIQAQQKHCQENKAPHFAPRDGRCWNCNKDIYTPYGWKLDHFIKRPVSNLDEADIVTGINLDSATNELVTGCPHCNKSYCD